MIILPGNIALYNVSFLPSDVCLRSTVTPSPQHPPLSKAFGNLVHLCHGLLYTMFSRLAIIPDDCSTGREPESRYLSLEFTTMRSFPLTV